MMSYLNLAKTLTQVASMTLLLAACSRPVNSDMTGTMEVTPIPSFPKVQMNETPPAPGAKQKYVQKADLMGQKHVPMDILFVVDTSQSMCSDQAAMKKNINHFVKLFLQNDKIDFHIGVTVTWDSRLYGNAVRKFKNGELRPVAGQGNNVRFVTPKTKNLEATLANTLYVGFEPFDKQNPSTTGPENEELFSPVLAALSDEMLAGVNQGFRRPEAHLAVIMVTDTEDQTPDLMDPSKTMKAAFLADELRAKVRGDATVTVLAALARLDEMLQFRSGKEPGLSSFSKKFNNGRLNVCAEYTVDPYLVDAYKGPEQIAELVQLTKGSAFDLKTNDFGAKMAGLGRTLLNKAMSFKVALDKVPDVDETMVLKINGKNYPRNDRTGWSYDASSNTILLNEGMNLGELEKFQVEIAYTVLN